MEPQTSYMKKKTKGTNLKSALLSPSKRKNWRFHCIFWLPLEEGHETSPRVPAAYTKPVGRGKWPNLGAKKTWCKIKLLGYNYGLWQKDFC